MRIFRGKLPPAKAPSNITSCYGDPEATNETLSLNGDIVQTFKHVSYGDQDTLLDKINHIRNYMHIQCILNKGI